MRPCGDPIAQNLPFEFAAIEGRLREIEAAFSLQVASDTQLARAGAFLWQVYSTLRPPPTVSGFHAWLQQISVPTSSFSLRQLRDKLRTIVEAVDPQLANDPLQLAAAGWHAWRAFTAWSAPRGTIAPHRQPKYLDPFAAWLQSAESESVRDALRRIHAMIKSLREQFPIAHLDRTLCAGCITLRLWCIALHQQRAGSLDQFVGYVNDLVLRAKANPEDLADCVLAASGCCGDNWAVHEIWRRIRPLVLRRAQECRRNPEEISIGDVLSPGGTNVLCTYYGDSRLTSYLFSVIRYQIKRTRVTIRLKQEYLFPDKTDLDDEQRARMKEYVRKKKAEFMAKKNNKPKDYAWTTKQEDRAYEQWAIEEGLAIPRELTALRSAASEDVPEDVPLDEPYIDVNTLLGVLPYAHALAVRYKFLEGRTQKEVIDLMKEAYGLDASRFSDCNSRRWRSNISSFNVWFNNWVLPHLRDVTNDALETGVYKKRPCECPGR